VITIADMVRAQAMLIDALGIETLFAVVGGSMGGMQVLQWAADYPERDLRRRLHRHGRAAFGPEHRLPRGRAPGDHGRSRLARRAPTLAAGHARRARAWPWRAWPPTSPTCPRPALQRKFGRELQRDGLSWGFDADFQVESYLRHQGRASSTASTPTPTSTSPAPWTISTWPPPHGGVLAQAFRRPRNVRFCVLSFTSDWLYPTAKAAHRARPERSRRRASFVEIESDKGHDAFLLDEPVMDAALQGFLVRPPRAGTEREGDPRGLPGDPALVRPMLPGAGRRLRRGRAAGPADP
jgi:homoserine O-acetyltransferase/O-succinyltransferase